ncbi:MAG: hypothetical protein Q7S26_01275 [bacterium]|nr:hypothetical protein [bacterium]
MEQQRKDRAVTGKWQSVTLCGAPRTDISPANYLDNLMKKMADFLNDHGVEPSEFALVSSWHTKEGGEVMRRPTESVSARIYLLIFSEKVLPKMITVPG